MAKWTIDRPSTNIFWILYFNDNTLGHLGYVEPNEILESDYADVFNTYDPDSYTMFIETCDTITGGKERRQQDGLFKDQEEWELYSSIHPEAILITWNGQIPMI